MTKLATRPTKFGAVVKYEDPAFNGYARSTRTLTLAGDGSEELGAVFAADGTIVLAADAIAGLVGTDISVLIDEGVYELAAGTTSADLAVLSGGPGASGAVVVKESALKFGDALNATQLAFVVSALNAKGIKVSK